MKIQNLNFLIVTKVSNPFQIIWNHWAASFWKSYKIIFLLNIVINVQIVCFWNENWFKNNIDLKKIFLFCSNWQLCRFREENPFS